MPVHPVHTPLQAEVFGTKQQKRTQTFLSSTVTAARLAEAWNSYQPLSAYADCTCSITHVSTLYHSSEIMQTIWSVQSVTENYRPYGSSLLAPSRTILEKWLWTVSRQGYLLMQYLRISLRYPNTYLKGLRQFIKKINKWGIIENQFNIWTRHRRITFLFNLSVGMWMDVMDIGTGQLCYRIP